MTTLTMIIAGIIALVSAILGGVAGRGLGKSAGRKEGAQQAQQQQEVIQAKETVKAVQERANVEVEVAAADESDLDRRLSQFDRNG